jgi:hypothetical protein
MAVLSIRVLHPALVQLGAEDLGRGTPFYSVMLRHASTSFASRHVYPYALTLSPRQQAEMLETLLTLPVVALAALRMESNATIEPSVAILRIGLW